MTAAFSSESSMQIAASIAKDRYRRACANGCCDPSGIGTVCASFPGVSSARGGLNPRLIDAIPPGSTSFTSCPTFLRRRTTSKTPSPIRKLNCSLLKRGVSLTEVLCVLAILSILMAFYGWAMMGAFVKVMAFLKTLH